MIRTPSAALLALALALPAAARADQRAYAFTYEAVTSPKGGLDLELYGTRAEPRRDGSAPGAWTWQAELEYGLTERWDVALYGVFARPDGGALEFDAAKLRSRYRLADPGVAPVDVVLYGEVEQGFRGEKPTVLEEKLILAKDVGRLNLALNLIAEQELEEGKVELEWGWAAGASWEFSPAFRLGAECFGAAKEVASASGEKVVLEAWAGPAVSVTLPLHGGPVRGAWLALGAGVGLTRDSEDLRVRGILAFQF